MLLDCKHNTGCYDSYLVVSMQHFPVSETEISPKFCTAVNMFSSVKTAVTLCLLWLNYRDQCLCCCRKQGPLMQDKYPKNNDLYVFFYKSGNSESISCSNLFTDHLCCLAGSTPTTFTLELPTSLQRISTRRCQSRCSYSRGALRSTQCAPVCTTLLSTMPCQ